MDRFQEIIDTCSEQAQELIDFGNSKEQAEGYGIKRVIDALLEARKEIEKTFPQVEEKNLQKEVLFTDFEMAKAMGYACGIKKDVPIELMKIDCLNYIQELKTKKNGGK